MRMCSAVCSVVIHIYCLPPDPLPLCRESRWSLHWSQCSSRPGFAGSLGPSKVLRGEVAIHSCLYIAVTPELERINRWVVFFSAGWDTNTVSKRDAKLSWVLWSSQAHLWLCAWQCNHQTSGTSGHSKHYVFLYCLQDYCSGVQIQGTAQKAFAVSKKDAMCVSEACNSVKGEPCFFHSSLSSVLVLSWMFSVPFSAFLQKRLMIFLRAVKLFFPPYYHCIFAEDVPFLNDKCVSYKFGWLSFRMSAI